MILIRFVIGLLLIFHCNAWADESSIMTSSEIIEAQEAEADCFEEHNFRRISLYLLPENHPLKPSLDQIFYSNQATRNDEEFEKAGFITLFHQPRSYIRVASHKNLPGYLVKANLDTDIKQKGGHPSWEWFVRRCIIARKIQEIITLNEIKHFVVPQKYLYLLPEYPVMDDPKLCRKYFVLIVEKMKLVSDEENRTKWLQDITEEHLDELYTILCHLPNMTIRASNIMFTNDHKLAFIDTEYVRKAPNFDRLNQYLSPEMQAYWKRKMLKRIHNRELL